MISPAAEFTSCQPSSTLNSEMTIASGGTIWTTRTVITNARRPRNRSLATAKAASAARNTASTTVTLVTSRLFRRAWKNAPPANTLR